MYLRKNSIINIHLLFDALSNICLSLLSGVKWLELFVRDTFLTIFRVSEHLWSDKNTTIIGCEYQLYYWKKMLRSVVDR